MENKITGDEPAFPDPLRGGEQSVINQHPHEEAPGLTIRQHYAGLAMQSLTATRTVLSFWQKVKVFFGCDLTESAKLLRFHPDCVAKLSVEQADALITALNTP